MNARKAGATASLLLLAGCQSLSPANFPSTDEILARGQFAERRVLAEPDAFTRSVDARTGELLARPLTVDAAVEIALLRDPDLQQLYGTHLQHGHAMLDAITRQQADLPSEIKLARAALLKTAASTDPVRFAEIYVEVADKMLGAGAEVRRAYWNAVAAKLVADLAKDAAQSAGAAAQTANEQYRSGTLARAEQAGVVLAAARANRALRKAEGASVEAREALIRKLGIWGTETGFSLPDHMPELPAALPEIADLEARAVKRLDVLLERGEGSIRMVAARARSEARQAYAQWQRAHEEADQIRRVMLPAQQAALADIQRRYNGMLVDVYALLKAVEDGLELRQDYIAALHDYVLAETELTRAIGGPFPREAVAAEGERK